MKRDWLLIIGVVLILAIGFTTLYSTVVGTEELLQGDSIINRQLLFTLVGVIFLFVISSVDYRFLGHAQIVIPLTGITVATLALLLVFGTEINNARRWIDLGFFLLQPSEFAKIILIIATAWLLSQRHKYNVWVLAAVASAVVVPSVVLIFLSPDLGTSVVLSATWVLMMLYILPYQVRNIALIIIALASAFAVIQYGAGHVSVAAILWGLAVAVALAIIVVRRRFYLIALSAIVIGLIGGVGMRYAWSHVFSDDQRCRVEAFLDPEAYAGSCAFQIIQSKIAIGSGMIWGKGFGHGTQSKLNFIAEHQTDFVFASFAEEFGLVGALALISLYGFVVVRILRASFEVVDPFGAILCVGIGCLIFVEVSINIAVNLGLVPTTGVPLPLMSAGGSMLLATMVGVGLVQSVVVHTEPEL